MNVLGMYNLDAYGDCMYRGRDKHRAEKIYYPGAIKEILRFG